MFTIEDVARMCHEANRVIQQATNDPAPSLAWDDAPQWQRVSAVEGVKEVLAGATPPEIHEKWCAYKRAAGWVFGHEKDEDARTHPCLVPYNYLPKNQKIKDDVFHAVVNSVRSFTDQTEK